MASQATPIAVFDISSSSVGGAHALVEYKNDVPTVTMLVQERRDSGLDEELNIQRFVENTTKALEVVIQHVRTADVHHPEYIQVVLSSPWYTSHARTIVYNKSTVFTATKRLVDSLIEKEVEFLLKETTANGDAFGSNFKVVEQQVSSVLLNGYPTTEPYGKKVQSMEINLIVTLVPTIVVDRFTSAIRRSYGDRTINVTTGPHAAFVSLRDHTASNTDCIIVDVGEEVTDIAFVKNGLFLSQHSFPFGTYELYRSLSAVTGSSVEARALIEAYRLKKLSPGNVRLVEKAIAHFAAQWQQALHGAAEQSAAGFRIPAQWYVVADKRFETLFPILIESDAYLQHAGSATAVSAVFLDPMNFVSKVRSATAEGIDTSLALGALFMERIM